MDQNCVRLRPSLMWREVEHVSVGERCATCVSDTHGNAHAWRTAFINSSNGEICEEGVLAREVEAASRSERRARPEEVRPKPKQAELALNSGEEREKKEQERRGELTTENPCSCCRHHLPLYSRQNPARIERHCLCFLCYPAIRLYDYTSPLLSPSHVKAANRCLWMRVGVNEFVDAHCVCKFETRRETTHKERTEARSTTVGRARKDRGSLFIRSDHLALRSKKPLVLSHWY
mmetsp:Transcript_13754/g.37825  ORF Transcript_13754/g.37825 Transcript_13754/m.37825 type:complete len:233 (-) Transcript_13754:12-710(-)